MSLLFSGILLGIALGGIASRRSTAPIFIIVYLFIAGIVTMFAK